MMDQIIQQLPSDPNGVIITFLVAFGIAIGSLVAMLGALHARPTLAVVMLAIGSVLAYVLPTRFGWATNPSVMITIGAVAFGLIGFIFHRFCVALLLAILVTGVVGYIVHDQMQPIDEANYTKVEMDTPLADRASNFWASSPPAFRRAALWVGPTAFVIGALAGYFLRTVGVAILFSLGGTILTLFAIHLGHASSQIHWLDSLKTGPMTTAALGMSMLLVGFVTQMVLLNRQSLDPTRPHDSDPMEP